MLGSGRWRQPKAVITVLSSAALVYSFATPITPALAAGSAFYVSPSGSDSNPGTIALPFLTLDHARAVVQPLTSGMTGSIQVYLRGGRYPLSAPVQFTPADSGSNGYTVNYAAYPGEVPVLSGGTKITSWTKIASGSTLNVWKATLPIGFQTRDVYVQDKRADRLTSTSGLQPDGRTTPVSVTQTSTGYVVNDVRPQSWANPTKVEFVWSGLGANTTDGFAEPRCNVASVTGDTTTSTITMQQPCYGNVTTRKNDPAFAVKMPTSIEGISVWSDLRTQIRPGQWYRSDADQSIFYFPRNGENMSTAKVVAGTTETLLKITGTPTVAVHDLAFSGITFTENTWLGPDSTEGFASTQANEFQTGTCPGTPPNCTYQFPPGAVDMQSTTNINFGSDIFSHLGGSALRMWNGSHNDTVNHSTLFDIAANGVEIGDVSHPLPATEALTDRGDIISYNYIHDAATVYHDGVGIWAGYVADATILNNEVYNLPYTGISFGWGWGAGKGAVTDLSNNRVAFNNVHNFNNFGVQLPDGAGIYLNGASDSTKHSTCTNNWIHDGGRAIAAIYFDGGGPPLGTSYWDAASNVVSTVESNVWFLIGGHNNSVTNNYTDAVADRASPGDASNVVSGNQAGLTTWPTAAQTIMTQSGVH